jgi:hypothetical protein
MPKRAGSGKATTKKAVRKPGKNSAEVLMSRVENADGEAGVQAKIAKLPEPWRVMGERLHVIIKSAAPSLTPRLWYGMPAYAKDGKIICFFRGGQMFKERYMTVGFSDKANLDEGALWPIAYALLKLTATEEKRIAELVKQAVR